MRVLLDHCVPKRFGRLLVGHLVLTSAFMGWDRLENGNLLAAAATEFDVLITVDKNMHFEQHAADLPMPVISLDTATNQPHVLAPVAPQVLRLRASPLENRIHVVRPPIPDR